MASFHFSLDYYTSEAFWSQNSKESRENITCGP